MPDPDFLKEVGLKAPDLFAGLSGGIVRTLFETRFKPVVTILSAVSGGLTANFLAQPFSVGFDKIFSAWFGGVSIDHGVAGFFVGLTAMTICQSIIAKVRRWSGAADDSPQQEG